MFPKDWLYSESSGYGWNHVVDWMFLFAFNDKSQISPPVSTENVYSPGATLFNIEEK